MNVKFNVMAFLLFILSLSACASPATPTAEVAPVPSDAESSVSKNEAGLYPLSTRTGIEDVDAVIAAVESGDPQQLHELFRFTSIACTNAEGLGGPPKCRGGEAEGTLVDVLPFLGPEGSFLHKENMSSFPGVNVIGVYAAYKVSEAAYSEEAYPAGEYAVLFKGAENQTDIIFQIRGGIVRIDYVFSPTPLDEIVQRDASELILAP